jgi:Fe-S-cluster containining protein
MKDRCDGTCCKAFVLGGYDRHELQRCYDNQFRLATEGQTDWVRPHEFWYASRNIDGILEWWPWVRYIGTFDVHPVTGEKNASDGPKDFFTCIQLAENGDCKVYEDRPHFCKSYGVTIECEHENCRWKGAWHKGEDRPPGMLVEAQDDLAELRAKMRETSTKLLEVRA